MANIEKRRRTLAIKRDEKIRIVNGLLLTTSSYAEYARSVDISINAIERWRDAIDAGDNWTLLSRAECDAEIAESAGSADNFKLALLSLRKKGCHYSHAHARQRMTKLGFIFTQAAHPKKTEYTQTQKHIARILKSDNWRSFQHVAEIVGCTVNTVSRIADFNGIASKVTSGRKRIDSTEDTEQASVKLRKPEQFNPIMAMALGMRI